MRLDAADTPAWHLREDRGGLLASHARGDGSLLVEGYAARAGVLEYRDAAGKVTRELVPESTLQASAGGLARAPVTLEHPREDVSPDNVAQLGVGDVDGTVRVEDGGFVRVQLAVRRRDAVTAVRRREKVELSPGYRVRIDPTPGVDPVYGRYDAVQVERVYNHLAIVSRGRGGPEVRLRADSAEATTVIRADSSAATRGVLMNPRLIALLAQLGVHTRVDSDDAAIDLALDAIRARKDAKDDGDKARADALAAAEALAATEKARADAATTALAAEKTRADTATTELTALRTAEATRLDAAERASLAPLATKFRIDAAKHPATAELKRALAAAHLTSLGVTLKEDASDAYIDLALDQAKATPARTDTRDGRDTGNAAWNPTPNPTQPARVDAQPAKPASAPGCGRYDEAFQKARANR